MSAGAHVDRDPATVEADVIRQREELAQTVDALSHKLDVKVRAQDKVADLRSVATTDAGRPRPELLVLAGAVVVGAVTLLWWRRRH